jgi:hypothetical protein
MVGSVVRREWVGKLRIQVLGAEYVGRFKVIAVTSAD